MKRTPISWHQMQGLVQDICRQIAVDDWRPDYVVGITRGGLTPAVLISQYLNIPMYALKVSLRDSQDDSESNLWMAEEAFGYVDRESRVSDDWYEADSRRRILIIDDINDSGATFQWIQQDWQASCGGGAQDQAWQEVWGHNVRFAVLVNNTSSQFDDVTYAARTINKLEDPQWIQFPWEEWWQNS